LDMRTAMNKQAKKISVLTQKVVDAQEIMHSR
jgi:hypothetical protein